MTQSIAPEKSFPVRPGLWAAAIIILGAALRLIIIATGQLNLVQDEAQYWDWTRHLQLSYYSKGPLIAWVISFFTGIFGDTELGVRFGAVAISTLSQFLFYLGVARIFGRPRIAFWTVFMLNTAPFFMAGGILMTTDNPLVFCWIAALFSLYLAGEGRGGWWPFVVLGLALALGTLAKYMMLAFVPLAVVYAILLARRGELPGKFTSRFAAAVIGGVVVGFLPILIWNAGNEWVGFRHVAHLAGVSGKKASNLIRFDRFPDFLGSQLGLVTPWWLALMFLGGWRAVKTARGSGTAGQGDQGLDRHQSLLLALYFWPLWLAFLVWSFHSKILGNWPLVSYGGGLILGGAALARIMRQGRPWLARSLAALGVVVFVAVHAAPLAPLPTSVDITLRLKGWEDLGRKVEELRETEFTDPDKVFIFSGLYDMTSELAFYTPGQPRTFNAWIDRRMNQYDLWPGPEDKLGWDAIYVRKYFKDHPEKEVTKMFKRISPPIQYQTTFNGRPARKFTIFLCYDFNGYWPRPAESSY